jgi:hypothetical protein
MLDSESLPLHFKGKKSSRGGGDETLPLRTKIFPSGRAKGRCIFWPNCGILSCTMETESGARIQGKNFTALYSSFALTT